MNDENYWPDVTAEEKTQCVFDFFATLKAQLKERYNGRIQCELEPIVYKTQGFTSALQSINEIITATRAPIEDKSGIEEGKNPVHVKSPKEYKFVIYDEKRFFRILDVKLGDYFPIQIRQSKGVAPNQEYKYYDVDSELKFKRIVLDCIKSPYVKDVIRYMLEATE